MYLDQKFIIHQLNYNKRQPKFSFKKLIYIYKKYVCYKYQFCMHLWRRLILRDEYFLINKNTCIEKVDLHFFVCLMSHQKAINDQIGYD